LSGREGEKTQEQRDLSETFLPFAMWSRLHTLILSLVQNGLDNAATKLKTLPFLCHGYTCKDEEGKKGFIRAIAMAAFSPFGRFGEIKTESTDRKRNGMEADKIEGLLQPY